MTKQRIKMSRLVGGKDCYRALNLHDHHWVLIPLQSSPLPPSCTFRQHLTKALRGALGPDSYSWKGTNSSLSPTPHLCGRRGYGGGGTRDSKNLAKVTEQWADRSTSLDSAGRCFLHHATPPAGNSGAGLESSPCTARPAQQHVLWLTGSTAHQVERGSRGRRTRAWIPARPRTSHVSQNKKSLLSKNELAIFKWVCDSNICCTAQLC